MKPFWKKKLFLLPAAAAVLTAIGVPNADRIVAVGSAVVQAAQGHSPK